MITLAYLELYAITLTHFELYVITLTHFELYEITLTHLELYSVLLEVVLSKLELRVLRFDVLDLPFDEQPLCLQVAHAVLQLTHCPLHTSQLYTELRREVHIRPPLKKS